MSEVILKALTQLFAIITKQDSGATAAELKFIEQFFKSRLNPIEVTPYINLFYSFYSEKKTTQEVIIQDETEKTLRKYKLTSMRDSLKTLSICKKINNTLTQKQKIVVLVELIELANCDAHFTKKRRQIIDTIAIIFNVPNKEYLAINTFVTSNSNGNLNDESILIISSEKQSLTNTRHIKSKLSSTTIFFLQVKSVGLYFIKKLGVDVIKLNNIEINHNHIYLYTNGSTLTISNGESIYFSDLVAHYNNQTLNSQVSFTCNQISYKFSNGKLGLHDITIQENRGGLIGIMGSSGAGKTTLLNVLAGIECPSSGEVIINGSNIHQDVNTTQGLIGYIAQDDLLIEELTVFDNLYYNAKLCFNDKSDIEIKHLVTTTLTNLGLTHIQNLKVGSVLNKKISGGQRKRLNIALELIREPAVLFVDEPTSGLSSRDSDNVIDLLKELSHRGKLIFVVIHQPSSEIYKKFDKMFFLDTGGYPVFYGNPIDAVIYFKKITNQINSFQGQCSECGNVNPEQIFDLIEARVVNEFGETTKQRKVSPIQWNDFFKNKNQIVPTLNSHIQEKKELNVPGRIKQWLTFIRRDSKSKLNNTAYLFINILEAPLLAVLLSVIIRYNDDPHGGYSFGYNENIPAFLLISIIISLFMGLSISAEEIIKDKKILKREKFLNLSKSSYLLSKTSILFTISAIQSLSFVIIGNYILEIQGMTFSYWVVLFSCACMANMMGLIISATFDKAVTVYILIPILLIPQMILSGAIFDFEKLNPILSSKNTPPIISDFMGSRWAYEALTVEQFKNNDYEKMYFDIDQELSHINYYQAYLIPELEHILNECALISSSKTKNEKELRKKLNVLKKEILKLNKDFPSISIPVESTTNNFINYTNHNYISYFNYLKQLQKHLKNEYKLNLDRKKQLDEILDQAYKKHGVSSFESLKKDYFNLSLEDLLRNINSKARIELYEGEFIQNIDPIYKLPSANGFFNYRTHFFSPSKLFLGKKFDTFWFNICVLWFMTFILYISLYFDIFKVLINTFKRITIRKHEI